MHPADNAIAERPNERGFTIIEMLVSLTVLAVILGLLSGGLRVLSQNSERNATRFDSIDMLSRAFDILRRDLAGLQRIATANGAAARYIFTGSDKKLSVVTLEPPYPTTAGPYFVDYSVQPNGKLAELVRARARYRQGLLAFPGATPANRVAVLSGPLDYRFSYAQKTPTGIKWLAKWPYPTRMPDLVRLEILDGKTRAPRTPPLVVPLRADAELGCIEPEATLCSAMTKGELMASHNVDSDQYQPKN